MVFLWTIFRANPAESIHDEIWTLLIFLHDSGSIQMHNYFSQTCQEVRVTGDRCLGERPVKMELSTVHYGEVLLGSWRDGPREKCFFREDWEPNRYKMYSDLRFATPLLRFAVGFLQRYCIADIVLGRQDSRGLEKSHKALMREIHLCWHFQEEFKSYSSEMMGVRIQEKKQKQKQEMWLLMNLTVHITHQARKCDLQKLSRYLHWIPKSKSQI